MGTDQPNRKNLVFHLRTLVSFLKSRNGQSSHDEDETIISNDQEIARQDSDKDNARLDNNRHRSFRKRIKSMHKRMKSYVLRREADNNKTCENRDAHEPVLATTNGSVENRDEPEPVIADSDTVDSDTHDQIETPLFADLNNSLSRLSWYWGPTSRDEAEEKLSHLPDGSFLIRDSSSSSYPFSVSFRVMGCTRHAHIEYAQGGCYSLRGRCNTHLSVVKLMEEAVCESRVGVYSYVDTKGVLPDYPVRLCLPVSRYGPAAGSPASLKHLCRYAIRKCAGRDGLDNLPLPSILLRYLQESPTVQSYEKGSSLAT